MKPLAPRFGKWLAAGLVLGVIGWWWLRPSSSAPAAREDSHETDRPTWTGPQRPPPLPKASATLPMVMEPFHDAQGRVIGYRVTDTFRTKKARVGISRKSPHSARALAGPADPAKLASDFARAFALNDKQSGILESALATLNARLLDLERHHCRSVHFTAQWQMFEISPHVEEAGMVQEQIQGSLEKNFGQARAEAIMKQRRTASGENWGTRMTIRFDHTADGGMLVATSEVDSQGKIFLRTASDETGGQIPRRWQHLFQLEDF